MGVFEEGLATKEDKAVIDAGFSAAPKIKSLANIELAIGALVASGRDVTQARYETMMYACYIIDMVMGSGVYPMSEFGILLRTESCESGLRSQIMFFSKIFEEVDFLDMVRQDIGIVRDHLDAGGSIRYMYPQVNQFWIADPVAGVKPEEGSTGNWETYTGAEFIG